MSKKTLSLIIVLFVITLVLLGVAVRSSKAPKPQVATAPTPTPVAHTTLVLSPSPVTVTESGSGSVDVLIDTGINKVTAVQLELAYDPTVLTNVKVTNGTFFTSPIALINNTDVKTGRISYAIGITPQQSTLTGTGTVAHITFTKKFGVNAQSTVLKLLPKSLVTATGISQTVLKATTSTKIIFSNTPSGSLNTTTTAPSTSSTGAVTK